MLVPSFFKLYCIMFTYRILFQNKACLLQSFGLFQLEKHIERTSIGRNYSSGVIINYVDCVYKEFWRQFSMDTQKSTKSTYPIY